MPMSVLVFVTNLSKALNLHHSGSDLQAAIKGSLGSPQAVFKWSSSSIQAVFKWTLTGLPMVFK